MLYKKHTPECGINTKFRKICVGKCLLMKVWCGGMWRLEPWLTAQKLPRRIAVCGNTLCSRNLSLEYFNSCNSVGMKKIYPSVVSENIYSENVVSFWSPRLYQGEKQFWNLLFLHFSTWSRTLILECRGWVIFKKYCLWNWLSNVLACLRVCKSCQAFC